MGDVFFAADLVTFSLVVLVSGLLLGILAVFNAFRGFFGLTSFVTTAIAFCFFFPVVFAFVLAVVVSLLIFGAAVGDNFISVVAVNLQEPNEPFPFVCTSIPAATLFIYLWLATKNLHVLYNILWP